MVLRKLMIVLLLLVMLGSVLPIYAQETTPCLPDSGVVITRQIESQAIGQKKSYNVYLPPNWCHLEDLPLLVMLHGLHGNHSDWVRQGHIDDTATELILAGEINPLVILMPDGDDSFYVNGSLGDYETYIVSELVGAVDSEFPTAATRESRSTGGLSMGGYGALYLTIRHPELFGSVGAHSPAILPFSAAPDVQYLYGEHNELFAERDIVSLIENGGWPPDTRLFIDVGNADFLLGGMFNLVKAIFDHAQIPDFQGHVWPGKHDWDYWSTHAADYLRFYAGVAESSSSAN